MKRTFTTLAAAGLLTAALTACGLPTAGPAASPPQQSDVGSSRPQPAESESKSESRVLSLTFDEESGDTEDPAERILSDAEFLQDTLDDYWETTLADTYGLEFDAPDDLVPYEGSGNPSCGGTQEDAAENAYYCPVGNDEDGDDEYIAYDIDWLAGMLQEAPGDAFTYLVLSHEWGHAVQDTWEEQQPGEDTWEGPAQELNADCLAGDFLQRAIEDEIIVVEEGDTEAIFGFLYAAGSGTWMDPGDHGTSEQRQQAFIDGAENGVDFCRVNY